MFPPSWTRPVWLSDINNKKSTTGDVKFDGCDAENVFIETDTGKIDVPRSVAGGSCEITTDTGDIKVGFQ